MQTLNLPPFNAELEERSNGVFIKDQVRKKWLLCTPEEWVRQHIVVYLHQQFFYPLSLMEIEKGLDLYGLSKRADIVLRGSDGQPFMVVECKAPEIKIGQDVFDQVSRYNLVLKAPYLLVTNGLEIHCWKIDFDKKEVEFLSQIPEFGVG